MRNAHKSLELLQARHQQWWELLPVREDISLALAMNKEFWKKQGSRYGWQSDKTPFELAMEESEMVSMVDVKKFYEESIYFEPGMSRSKVGSWCWWVSVKNLV